MNATRVIFLGLSLAAVSGPRAVAGPRPDERFRAGAAAVEVSPSQFPVLINGGFLQAQTDRVRDPLFARAIVMDDGTTRIAVVVVDSCMMPRELLDRAKELASKATGIPTGRMLVSATHTHTAPAAMGALGCFPDAAYVEFLPGRIAEAIEKASANLAPARAGWASVEVPEFTHCRRWIRKPDKMVVDPFGKPTGRAHMHPGYQNPDAIGPSGPVDPELSVFALQSPDGRPIALLANYSMHYFGAAPASADYFGRFAAGIGGLIGVKEGGQTPPFVAMMSQGTSGDQQWMDYGAPKSSLTLDAYAAAVTEKAASAYKKIAFQDGLKIAMAEAVLKLGRRVPDEARLAWARPIVAEMGNRPPKSIPEVYAREAVFLHDEPTRELKLQAVRIGELGITAIPNEVYALTGLKIKARSPLASTFNIELANGSEGYIPPPEQHALGGYTTWPARTAALEVQAEPRIVSTVLQLLEEVSGRPLKKERSSENGYAAAVAGSKPWAYWRLDEMDGRIARDHSGRHRDARLEDGAALFLEGPGLGESRANLLRNRSVHLAGGRFDARSLTGDLKGPVTVEFWFWNGLPTQERAVCAVLLDTGGGRPRLEIGGAGQAAGRLLLSFANANRAAVTGQTVLEPKKWYHVAVVLGGEAVSCHLDGRLEFKAETRSLPSPLGPLTLCVGGGEDVATRLEGKIDEVAVYDRVLGEDELRSHLAGADGRE